jgi:hypothetical protein
MNPDQVVTEAEKRKAFVSPQRLDDFLRAYRQKSLVRLDLLTKISNAEVLILSAVAPGQTDESTQIKIVAEVILDSLSHAMMSQDSLCLEQNELKQVCIHKLKQTCGDHYENMDTLVAKATERLKEAVSRLVNQLSLEREINEQDRFKLHSETMNYLDEIKKLLIEPDEVPSEPFWQKLTAIGSQVSEQEWEKLPTDLSRNFEHYMYGASKEV